MPIYELLCIQTYGEILGREGLATSIIGVKGEWNGCYQLVPARQKALISQGLALAELKLGPSKDLKTAKTPSGSRGMSLEDRHYQSNQYYLSHNLAVVTRKPTPIQVVKMDCIVALPGLPGLLSWNLNVGTTWPPIWGRYLGF